MPYFDFLRRKERAFLKNIYLLEDLSKSPSIKNLESYYDVFKKFLQIISSRENHLNNSETNEGIYNTELKQFLEKEHSVHSDSVNCVN